MGSQFKNFAPFIREYIYAKGWETLRPIQEETAELYFETDAHLLLAGETASGKTEAAFFPALTRLYENPSASVGILYISPLKALINDQFHRMQLLLRDTNISVWRWHGDVAQNQKTNLLRNPSGILQITPESLEGMLMNKPSAITRLFSDLQCIVIDEVHAFMGTDRGEQVLCQMARLERMIPTCPRRIGLSATLNRERYDDVGQWLVSGSRNQQYALIDPPSQHKRTVQIGIDNFTRLNPAGNEEMANQLSARVHEDMVSCLYGLTHKHKAIIFSNTRHSAELYAVELRSLAAKRKEPDVFYVHHGSIAQMLREEAESAMRDHPGAAVTLATLTLELGIDLGDLDLTAQIGAPYRCSNFVQRLGRSGRNENRPSRMAFIIEEELEPEADLPQRIPWQLLRAIAIVELYLRENWVEPNQKPVMPLSLLYHQTMSALKSIGELSPTALRNEVLSLPSFSQIQDDEYSVFLQYLLRRGELERTEIDTLLIGTRGERTVNNFRFLAVFPDQETYDVFEGSEKIGDIEDLPPVGYCIALAGKVWRVANVLPEEKRVIVKRTRGKLDTLWMGRGGEVDERVLAMMRQVLVEDQNYPYLRPGAVARLMQARAMVREAGLLENNVLPAGNNSSYLFPWMGSRAFDTLERWLRLDLGKRIGIQSLVSYEPCYFKIGGIRPEALLEALKKAAANEEIGTYSVLGEEQAPRLGKFDDKVEPELLRKSFFVDHLDVEGMRKSIELL